MWSSGINLARRRLLGQMSTGLTGVALARLLGGDVAGAADAAEAARKPHHPAKAKQVLQIFCPGAASHVDLWDYKPSLWKYNGKPLPGDPGIPSFQGKNGNLMQSPWPFAPAGKSGKMISSMLPNMAAHVDDIAFVHSMTSRTNTHGPGCIFMNSCFTREGFPSAGSWVSYALGSLNDNLPTYIAIQDVRGEPPNGKANWNNGFLPAQHQAVAIAAQQNLRNLATPAGISRDEEAATRDFLRTINAKHAEARAGNDELTARMSAYELAARMQMATPEVADLSREPAEVHTLYGTDDKNALKAAYARNCLLARRFLEKGVRYVSLYCASRASAVDGLLNWDAHKTLKSDYERHCPVFDQPTAALLTDMKRRGMLDDVLVIWCTEFGRMPTHQEGTSGRDHNPDAFTAWMMGAGIKGGVSYGATDEFGRRSAEKIATPYDFYATILHLLGLDHEKLTYYHNGAARRLTDVHGHVIGDVLA
ncbi:DUF1501 domain-containing protein [Humisphaera borealis]|uniref:DUF1501 domain-containing protein n=1 Tax=Humisphaera borealis TaxID=2807512 RepID=A0A7M2X3G4_9BACT|nr:DUF1501 domain-containing protein [Humisphaera borealis]QOV91310.1 DUF1501 domain-containing protein [Humisphaera borealis]